MTDLVVVLDRSGSMDTGRADHEGGLRSFVRDQSRLAGEVRLTFVRFDTHEPFELVYDRTPLGEVQEEVLSLVPRAGTPLLEALSRALTHMETTLALEPPHPVFCLVITDGEENSSRAEFTKARIRAQIAARQAAGWTVLYLGANVDAFHEAGGLGVASAGAMGYAPTTGGISAMYAALTNNTLHARSVFQSAGASGMSMSAREAVTLLNTTVRDALSFSDDQRENANNPTTPDSTGAVTP